MDHGIPSGVLRSQGAPGTSRKSRNWGRWASNFDALESRILLSSVYWDGGAGTLNWGDAANWNSDTLPTADDDVTIDVPEDVTITHFGGSNSVNSLFTQERILLSGGTLTLVTGGTLDGGLLVDGGTVSVGNSGATIKNLTLSAGAISGTGNVTITGHLEWTDGYMNGTGRTILAASSTATVNGPDNFFARGLVRTLENYGEITIQQSLNILRTADQTQTGILANLGSGLVTFVGNAGVRWYAQGGYGRGRIENAATVRHIAAGTSTLDVEFNNTGVIDGQQGTLKLAGTGNLHGQLIVSPEASVQSTGTLTLVSLGGPGVIEVTAGTLTLATSEAYAGSVTVSGGVLSPIPGGATIKNLTLSAGAISGTGNVTITGHLEWTDGYMNGTGRTILAASSTATVNGPDNFFARGLVRTLENYGEITIQQSLNILRTADQTQTGILANLGSGLVTFVGNAGVRWYAQGGYGRGRIENAATVRHIAAGTSTLDVEFNNTGVIDGQQGTLKLAGTGNLHGQLIVSPEASVQSTGTLTLVSLGGPGVIEVAEGTLTLATSEIYAGSVTVSGGVLSPIPGGATIKNLTLSAGAISGTGNVTITGHLEWTDGYMNGTGRTILAASSTATVNGPDNFFARGLVRTLENYGEITIQQSLNILRTADQTQTGILANLGSGLVTFVGNAGVRWYAQGGYGRGRIENAGTVRHSAAGTSTLDVEFNNSGSIDVQSGVLNLGRGDLQFDGARSLNTNVFSTLRSNGSLTGSTTNADRFNSSGSLVINGGSSAEPRSMEVMGKDLGAVDAGYQRNFAYGLLTLESAYVSLIDSADNALGGGSEALYVDTLIVPAGSTLALNSLKVYARVTQIDGSVLDGTVTIVPDSTTIPMNSSRSGVLSAQGEVDEWRFFGRAGESVAVYVNPGDVGSPPPASPTLNYANVEILDPSGNVLESGISPVAGQTVKMVGVNLNTDGLYRIRVKASDSQPTAQGNYFLSLYDATLDIRPLVFNQRETGKLETPFSVDQWTFSGNINQQVRFDWVNANVSGLRFSLTGPDGWVGFIGQTSDSDLIILPANGTYVLEAASNGAGAGSYAFAVDEISQTNVALGEIYSGTLTGSGNAQLFTVAVPDGTPLRVEFDDSTPGDRNELYLRLGAPPTRRQFDYRNTEPGADHRITVPLAAPGVWYILVYGEGVPSPSNFTLRPVSNSILLTDVTPKSYTGDQTATLTISGTGFLPGSQVELVSVDGTHYVAQSVSIDAFDRLSAVFDLSSVLKGKYDLHVSQTGGAVDVLPSAFEVLEPGLARLETRLLVDRLRRTGYWTAFVEYANTGTAAMPAPILILRSGDPYDYIRLTLDQSLIAPALRASGRPDGIGNSVQFLASGNTPGLLLPGERIRVPVHYVGEEQPWDLTDGQVEWELLVHEAGSQEHIDWGSLQSTLQPSWIADDAWAAVFGNLASQIGSTWGNYVQTLSDNAAYLGRFGIKVNDISQLFSFELQQANGLNPVSVLASALDASLPTPGLPLGFGRSFGNTIMERYQLGAFGRGWAAPTQSFVTEESHTDIHLVPDPNWSCTPTPGHPCGSPPLIPKSIEFLDAVVINAPGGTQRRFYPGAFSGGFSSLPNETGKLTIVSLSDGDHYQLTESSGFVSRFYASGPLKGKLEHEQDVNGNRLTYGYTDGRLSSMTHSSGAALTFAYNAAGLIASISDSAGRTTAYGYDPTNTFLLSVTGPAGTTSYTYDTGTSAARKHDLLTVTDPSGVMRHFDYDDRGRLIGTFLAGNLQKVEYGYDEAGKVTVNDAVGVTSTLFFDHRGLVVRSEDALGSYVNYEYNAQRQLIRETNVMGHSKSFTWCDCGSVTSVTDENGRTTTFSQGGPNNQPTAFTDARGSTTRYAYDAVGNLTGTTYPDGSIERVAYNAAGDPTQLVNRRGQSVNLSYNAAGQLTHEAFPDGSTVDFVYDVRARLATATDHAGTTSFTYDLADRLTRVEYPNGRWLAYAYDAAGRRVRMEDHSGFVVQYRYDSVGRLSGLRDGSAGLIVNYTYDAAGRLIREDKGNGTYSLYTYDGSSRQKSIVNHAPDGTINSQFAYTYNARGQRTGTSTLDGDWTYTYDLTSQLTRAVLASTNPNIPDQDLRYEYDVSGNRVRTVINGLTTDYTTNALNQYLSAGTTTYRYDLDGNLIEESTPDGTKRYTYNVLNQLVAAVTRDGTWQYEYDTSGNRIATIINGQRTEYLIDPTGQVNVTAEYDGSGNRIASYMHGFRLEGAFRSAGWGFYDFDALGSTVGISGSAGAYMNRYSYDPFGSSLLNTEAISNSYEYVGAFGVMSEGNGLQFMRSRFYGIANSRFISPDRIGLSSGDSNYYRYASNSPAIEADYDGRESTVVPIPNATNIFGWRGLYDSATDTVYYDSTLPYAKCVIEHEFEHARLYKQLGPHDCYASETRASWVGYQCAVANGYNGYANVQLQKFRSIGTGGPYKACGTKKNPFKDNDIFVPPSRIDEFGISPLNWSSDPNEKYGAAGYGAEGFIPADELIPYRVNFENLGPGSVPVPTQPATASAQRVEVTDQLSSLLDWNTLRFTEFGFGDNYLSVPEGLQYYFAVVPMTDNGETFNVEVELSLDSTTGMVRAVFQCVDPKTSLPPMGLAGFLLPEDGTGNGKGYFGFTIQPKVGLPTGTALRNIALISFDDQTIIATDQIDPQDASQGVDPGKQALNTIDSGKPNSTVNALPLEGSSRNFDVQWSGSDDVGGSGIASYDIYVSDNGLPFLRWLSNVTGHTATYNGQNGHTYSFYSVATDNVGHREDAPSSPDSVTSTTLAITSPAASTTEQRPRIEWTPGFRAASYDVQINNRSVGSSLVLKANVTDSNFTPTFDLGIGRFAVWVRSVDADGKPSAWSYRYDFSITTPAALQQIAPLQLTMRPTLRWNSLAGAVRYDLWINNLTTGKIQFVRDQLLSGLSWTPSSDLPIGHYQAWIRGIDAAGLPALWSRAAEFQVSPPVVLTPMARFQPTSRPVVQWGALSGAAKYELWVNTRTTDQNQLFHRQFVTSPVWTSDEDMPLGEYRAWVRAFDAAGTPGQWSSFVEFRVATPPQVLAPLNSTFNRKPTFSWNAVTGANRYEVQVRNLWTSVTVSGLTAATETNWTPSANLADGPSQWWVRAIGIHEVRGLWTASTDIYIGGQTRLLTPTGRTSETTPVFFWKTVDGADRYELWVTNVELNARLIHHTDLTSLTFLPSVPLPRGTYRAWVRAISKSGEYGVWSPQADFLISSAVAIPELPAEDGSFLVSLQFSELTRTGRETPYEFVLRPHSQEINAARPRVAVSDTSNHEPWFNGEYNHSTDHDENQTSVNEPFNHKNRIEEVTNDRFLDTVMAHFTDLNF